MAGWEGSANDGRIFHHTLEQGLIIPKGSYYLTDGRYTTNHKLLVPYRSIQYHLQETARAGLRPANYKELYNLRHNQLRTLIERVIGRLKGTFRIHRIAPTFPLKTQIQIIYATSALLNWLIDFGDLDTNE